MYHHWDDQELVSFTGGVSDCHHERLSADVPIRRADRKIPSRNVNNGETPPLNTTRKIERKSSRKPSPNPNLNGGRNDKEKS